MQLSQLFLSGCCSLVLFLSLVENGGAAGQDEEREADFHSLLCLSLQGSAGEVLTWLPASRETTVNRIIYLCGVTAFRNVEYEEDCCTGRPVGTWCGFTEGSKVTMCWSPFPQFPRSLLKCLFIVLTCRVEYVTITPDGFRYRSQIFPTVNGLFRWFKDHYHEPVPGTP